MLAEAGAPELVRHEVPSKLLQPLVPRYEEALSQLERVVKVRSGLSGTEECGAAHGCQTCPLPLQEELKQKAA